MAAYLTIEYNEKLDVQRVTYADGRVITKPMEQGPARVTIGSLDNTTIVGLTDDKGQRMYCVKHRCRWYC